MHCLTRAPLVETNEINYIGRLSDRIRFRPGKFLVMDAEESTKPHANAYSLASSVNWVGSIILAINALTAPRRTKMNRGAQRLIKGMKIVNQGDEVESGSARAQNDQLSTEHAEEQGEVQSPDGHEIAEEHSWCGGADICEYLVASLSGH